MIDIEDLPEHVQNIARDSQELRSKNAQAIGALEKLGMSFELSVARVEFLVSSLVDLGLITDEQAWEMHLAWEENLATQLQAAALRLQKKLAERAMQEQAQANGSGRKPTGLARPTAKRLIVPGQE